MGLAQFEQPFGFASVHARVLGAPHVKRRIIETAFASDLLDRHAWLGPLQKPMIRSSLYLLVLMSIIFHIDGLLGKMAGTVYGEQITPALG